MPELRKLRSDLRYFAAAVAVALADWQAVDLTMDAPITALLWARQLGKSRGLALVALHAAFAKPETQVLIVSGGGELGARRLLREVSRIATGSELLRGSVVDDAGSVVRLSNGSEIRCVPASEAAVRGWSVDVLLVDECQLVSDDLLLGAALPTVTARAGGRVILAGTASVADGAFFDLCRRGEVGDEHVRFSRRVSNLVGGEDHAPWLTASMLEASMAAMGEVRANAEYRCQWASGADRLFTRQTLDRVIGDYRFMSLSELRGWARFLGGSDWASTGADHNTLVLIGRLPIPGEMVAAVACAERWPAGTRPLEVAREIAGSGALFDTLTSEVNGLGAPCSDELFARVMARSPAAGGGRRAGAVLIQEQVTATSRPKPSAGRRSATFTTWKVRATTSAASKAAGYGALRMLFDRGQLLLPASATALISELLLLSVDLSPRSGEERIEASAGHDDLADSLMLATCPHRPRGAKWQNLLTQLADPRRALPDVSPPADPDAPTVRTGGGLELPREPWWQSVRGPELTAPPGVSYSPEDAERARAEMELPDGSVVTAAPARTASVRRGRGSR